MIGQVIQIFYSNLNFQFNSDTYILVSGIITVVGEGTDNEAKPADRNNKQVIFKNCTLFIDCITEVNNTQVDNAKDLDFVMPMYN